MEVGLREANQRFSTIIKAVRDGEEVLLTERGKPLARLVPVRRPADRPRCDMACAGLNRFAPFFQK
jgi:prevent-host-death family protein